MERALNAGKKVGFADFCGWLSLACALPYVAFALGIGKLNLPEWLFPALLWSLFLSPIAGSVLALLAAVGRRWWLVLAAVWLVVLVYGWWDLKRHPFVI
jgi:hypothetical protein